MPPIKPFDRFTGRDGRGKFVFAECPSYKVSADIGAKDDQKENTREGGSRGLMTLESHSGRHQKSAKKSDIDHSEQRNAGARQHL